MSNSGKVSNGSGSSVDCKGIDVVTLVVSESNKTTVVWEVSKALDSVEVTGCFDC